MILKPGLYLVATPIGNLNDITLRALNILKNSDIIFCEDTRVSQKLLVKHNILARLQVYNDHSDDKIRKIIIDYIQQGKIVSLISDAGTPLISDPGYKLVNEVQKLGYYIDACPGPCSAITALTLSGLPTDKFLFYGFLPKSTESKLKVFSELSTTSATTTLIFFETSQRLLSTLKIAYNVYGNREACIARELTKLYQDVKTLPLTELIKCYETNEPKGEIVLLISKDKEIEDQDMILLELLNELNLFFQHNIPVKSTAEILSIRYKSFYTKKEIYKLANEIKNKHNSI